MWRFRASTIGASDGARGQEPLKTLAAETNETAHLAVREGRKALFIDHVTSSHVIRRIRADGRTRPPVLHLARQSAAIDFEEQDLVNLFGSEAAEGVHKNTIQSIRSLARRQEHPRKGFRYG